MRTVDTGGASPISALISASQFIRTGYVDVVAVVAGDAVASMPLDTFLQRADVSCQSPDDPLPSPVIPNGYDRVARWAIAQGHVTREQLAMCSVLMSANAARHPLAMTRRAYSLDEVRGRAGASGRGPMSRWWTCGGGDSGGVRTAKTVKRPRQQPAHPQYANYWAPLTRKRHIPPHSAQPQHTNYWAPRTRKRHQQEHRPQRPTESSDPTQHAKGRTGDCPGPRKGATTRRNVTQGDLREGGNSPSRKVARPPAQRRFRGV